MQVTGNVLKQLTLPLGFVSSHSGSLVHRVYDLQLVQAIVDDPASVPADVLAAGRLDAEEATRRLINRLLHDPTTVLRAAAAEPGGPLALDATLKRLFDLEGETADPERTRGPAEEEDT